MLALRIANRSPWPTPALTVLAKWIAKRAGVKWRYTLTVANVGAEWRDNTHYAGRASRNACRVRFHRRCLPPFIEQDHRRGVGSMVRVYRSRLELFAFLIAHEMYHATGGCRAEYQSAGRTDRAGMEYDCNLFAAKTVHALRAEWSELRPRIYAAMRAAAQRKHQHAAVRFDPSPKLRLAQDALVTWERKAKLARTKIAKYRRRVTYYSGKVAARATA